MKCRGCDKDKPDIKARKIGKEAEMELCSECHEMYLELERRFLNRS